MGDGSISGSLESVEGRWTCAASGGWGMSRGAGIVTRLGVGDMSVTKAGVVRGLRNVCSMLCHGCDVMLMAGLCVCGRKVVDEAS